MLITLGSPNVLPERFRKMDMKHTPYALKNLKFVDENCREVGGEAEGLLDSGDVGVLKERGREGRKKVKMVCVGSRAVRGGRLWGGLVRDWAGSSYGLCGYDDELEGGEGVGVWGDGITPVESALGLPGAEKVELEGRVLHGPEVEERGGMWYGTDPWPLETWLPFVLGTEGGTERGAGGRGGREGGGDGCDAGLKEGEVGRVRGGGREGEREGGGEGGSTAALSIL